MNSEEQLEIMSYIILEEMFLEMVGLCFAVFTAVSSAALWFYENDSLKQQPRVREGLRFKENIIANSINELGKNFEMWLKKSSERLDKVADRLGVDRDVFNDSRSLLNELKKMDLTEQERFAAAEKILSVPHRLHIFWGCNDVKRLVFVKSLI